MATAGEQLAGTCDQAIMQGHAALATEHGPGPLRVRLLKRLSAIAQQAQASLAHLDAGPSRGLVGPLARRHADLLTDLTKARNAFGRSAAASSAAADLLAGPHRFLVLAANNAEMRAGSGIFLEAGTLTTRDGQMQLSPMRSVGEVRPPPPGAPVPAELAARWGFLQPGLYWENLALNPQFDVAGPLAAQMWQLSTGEHVDGVMAVDIEALRQLLAAVGPVTTDQGTRVNADNAVSLLMHDQYVGAGATGDQAARREMLGSVARASFDSANGTAGDLTALATGMARAGNGRHILVWSAQPDVEDRWKQAGAAGELQREDLLVGLVNFRYGGDKLDWFMDMSDVLTTSPAPDATDVTVQVHVHNRTPPGQPPYIAAGGPVSPIPYGEYQGYLAMNIPGSATGGSTTGRPVSQSTGAEGPTQLLVSRIDLKMGQAQDVIAHFRLPGNHGQLRIVPTGRVPSVPWNDGQQSFTDSVAQVVSW